tara:strand:+ start:821 stop:1000 length:180 start_codon:yes stop_codon:yes gene_type:complete
MTKPQYDACGMVSDPQRLDDARHVTRDPATDEISWPPSRMTDVLRELKLIDEKDHDHDT